MNLLNNILPSLLDGSKITLLVFFITLLFSIPLSIMLAAVQNLNNRVINKILWVYIYVERGTVIKFTNKTYFASYTDEYLTAVKSGENELTALPITIEADDEGYFSFRVTDDYYFVTMVQGVTNPDTDETMPWYQFLIDLLNKIKEFFAKLFG